MDITAEMPSDLARAVTKVVREGREYGITVLIRAEDGEHRLVDSVDVDTD